MRKTNRQPLRVLTIIAFILYGVMMFWLLFGQRLGAVSFAYYTEQLSHSYNLIPFKTIVELARLWESGRLVSFSLINFFGNIVMFVPLGWFLPCLFPSLRRFGPYTLCVAVMILIVELMQFFTLLGVGDIDDLILNVIGGMIGFAVFRIASAHRKTINNG